MTKTGLSRPTAHKKIITNNDMQKIATYLQADDDAQVLQYKVWYSLGVHFVSRGLEFHHQLTLNSFSFHQDDDGREYVAHSPVKCEIPKNTRPRHLKIVRTQYIFVSNCFDRYKRIFNRAKGYKLYRLIFF